MFKKKTKTVAEVIQAVNSRVEELTKKSADKGQGIEEKKLAISKLLADLALADDQKNQESLKLARKALERMTESYNDTNEQITLLQGQRSQLERELIEARVRDLPPLVTKQAEDFNLIFAEAVKAVEVLRGIQGRMMEKQSAFKSLSSEYDQCCRSLEIVQPLEIGIGLGALAGQGSPYGSSFVVSDQVETFCASIIIYQSKIEASKNFKIENPDYTKTVQETADRDAQPYEFHLLRNHKIFGQNMH